VRFQVLTAASMKMTVFWDVAPCSLVDVYYTTWGNISKDSHRNTLRQKQVPLDKNIAQYTLHGFMIQDAAQKWMLHTNTTLLPSRT
jgi:hypothetical protein